MYKSRCSVVVVLLSVRPFTHFCHTTATMLALPFVLLMGLASAIPNPATIPPSPSPCPTICADFINECGKMFGGCFADPKCTGGTAWPSFTPPPCPSSTTKPGLMYGGCFTVPEHAAGAARPTPAPPPCPPAAASCPKICMGCPDTCGGTSTFCMNEPKCTGGSTTKWPTFSQTPCV